MQVYPEEFNNIAKGILERIIQKKDWKYDLQEKIFPDYHSNALEADLKQYFFCFLLYLSNLFVTIRKKNDNTIALESCKKIVELFINFQKILAILEIGESKLQFTEFQFTEKNLVNYIRNPDIFQGNLEAENFLIAFFEERRFKTPRTVFVVISHIYDISSGRWNCQVHQVCNLIRELWFKLHISTFYRLYIKNYKNTEEVPIPEIRHFFKQIPQEKKELAERMLAEISKR